MIITPYPIYPDEVANFTLYDPIIPKGTIAVNTDEGDGRAKIGDGVNNWSDLPYMGGTTIGVVPVTTSMPVNNEILRYSDFASSLVYTLQGMVDTQTNWETNNDVFPSFCILIETDDITDEVTGRVKFSDGVTTQDQIPWIWFNYDDWPTGYGIYYNGTTIDYKQFQEYNVLPFASAPVGKFLEDNGTWSTPVISDYTFDSIEADYGSFGTVYIGDFPSETTTVTLTSDGTDLFSDGNKVWTQYNDGSGSGLDADTLDGHHYTYFATGPETAVNTHFVSFGTSPNILEDSNYDPASFALTLHFQDSNTIDMPTNGEIIPTYNTLEDYFNIQGAGRISGGLISDNTDGTIAISAGYGIIKNGTSYIENSVFIEWDEFSTVTLTDNALNYIYITMESNVPVAYATTTRSNFDLSLDVAIGRVYRSGTTLNFIQSGNEAFCITSRIHERLIYTDGGIVRSNGGVISEVGTRNIASTAGKFYLGLNAFDTTAKDTSGTDTFTYWYRDGSGGWTSVASQTQIDNTHYDDGDGTLGTLGNNEYGVHWAFISFDGSLHVLYGQSSYTLTNANNATIPSSLPALLSSFCTLAAKIIIQKSAASFTSITSAYTTVFPVSSPSDHNDLGGLQGGTTNEYYHLTSAQATTLTANTFCRWRGSAASAPADPTGGDIYYNSGDSKTYIYNGTGWDALN